MATVTQNANRSASPVVRTIEGDMRWSGSLSFNFIDTPAEGRRVAREGVSATPLPDGWVAEIERSLSIYDEIVALDISTTTSSGADFMVGVDASPELLGRASLPQTTSGNATLIVGFNILADAHMIGSERGGGGERLKTIIHEIGHTLGLNHPHEDSGGTTVAPGAMHGGFSMPSPFRGHQTTLSYASAPNTVGVGFSYAGYELGRAVTPMAIDIAALHRLYGANMETRTGDTTYRLTDAQSADLDLDSSDGVLSVGRAYYGIWDAGTADTDTIRYDGPADVLLNLMAATPGGGVAGAQAVAAVERLGEIGALDGLGVEARGEIEDEAGHAGGFFSSVLTGGGVRVAGGYAIAEGVVIEVAAGGSGDDLLIGNAADNTLIGNGGDDVLAGGAGADVARYAGRLAAHDLSREGEGFAVSGASGADRLHDVEALAFDDAFVLIDTVTSLSSSDVATVGYLYEAGLDRDGALDVAGLTFWLDAREEGFGEGAMAWRFLTSDEFAARNGRVDTLSDRALVETLYRNVLDRAGEGEGVDYWTDVMEQGFTRGGLLLAFAESDENVAGAPVLSVHDDAMM